MSYFDRIRACNRWEPAGFLPFYIEAEQVGRIRPVIAERLKQWPESFRVDDDCVRLSSNLTDFASRTAALERAVGRLVDQEVIPSLHGEIYPVTPHERAQALATIDRAAARYFGVRTFGQHVNGYTFVDGELRMWIGRRAADRYSFPGKLDNLAAGGLPHECDLVENLAKECWEEAGISRDLVATARSVGVISYLNETPAGLKPDTLYCYDLALPCDFRPHCKDGEMQEFYLWSLSSVAEIVRDSTEFKPNVNLVVIDFLLRHGFITPDEPDYVHLVNGLRTAPPNYSGLS